jgi:hypothetical protein
MREFAHVFLLRNMFVKWILFWYSGYEVGYKK